MPRNTHEEMIAVIKAHQEGKKIEYRLVRSRDSRWVEATNPLFGFYDFEYRVKPEPARTRPYRRYIGKCWDKTTYMVGVVYKSNDPSRVESSQDFVRWIDTEWQTHEI